MYDKYFGLSDKPFSIAPDPRYLFMSDQHREALAHLVYGVGEGGGFVMLTGEVGTGKTTVCRCLLEQIPVTTRIAFILNPKLSATELLATACDELAISYPDKPTLKQLNDALNGFLLRSHAAGLKIVLMIDEAQNLSAEILEQIRLLTNLETNKEKLLQIILIGQPELKDMLAKHELRQLAQRITARFHLRPLTVGECESYILHRLEVSGFNDSLFDNKAIQELYKRTGGIPRLINIICDRAMLGAYAKNRKQIGANVVKQAANEVMGNKADDTQSDVQQLAAVSNNRWRTVAVSMLVILIVVSVYVYKLFQEQGEYKKDSVQQQSTEKENNSDKALLLEQQLIISQQAEKLQKAEQEKQQLMESIEVQSVEETEMPSIGISAENTLARLVPFLRSDIRPTIISDAQQQLLTQWNINYQIQRDGEFCDFAKSHQLRCDNGSADWWLIRIMDRPVILKLKTDSALELYGVLVAIDDKNVLINFSGEELLLTRSEVSEYWNGDYAYVWQAPQDYSKPLSLAMAGRPVQWLITGFAKLENLDLIVPPTANYDINLVNKVKDFQRQHSLRADGVAGPHTLMALNTLTGKNIPTLSMSKRAN